MVGGDEHNDIESRAGCVGYNNWTDAPADKETWWWNETVQEVINANIYANKTWETPRRQEDQDRYRQANEAANKAVATAKPLATNELYDELKTPEGDIKISRVEEA